MGEGREMFFRQRFITSAIFVRIARRSNQICEKSEVS